MGKRRYKRRKYVRRKARASKGRRSYKGRRSGRRTLKRRSFRRGRKPSKSFVKKLSWLGYPPQPDLFKTIVTAGRRTATPSTQDVYFNSGVNIMQDLEGLVGSSGSIKLTKYTFKMASNRWTMTNQSIGSILVTAYKYRLVRDAAAAHAAGRGCQYLKGLLGLSPFGGKGSWNFVRENPHLRAV